MGGWGLALQSGAPASQRTSMNPGTSWAQTEVAERISVNTKAQAARFRSRRVASALFATRFRRIRILSLVISEHGIISADTVVVTCSDRLFYEGGCECCNRAERCSAVSNHPATLPRCGDSSLMPM